MSNKLDDFKSELRDLLEKYDAIIYFDYDDDGYDSHIYEPRICVDIKTHDVTLNDDYQIDSDDIK